MVRIRDCPRIPLMKPPPSNKDSYKDDPYI